MSEPIKSTFLAARMSRWPRPISDFPADWQILWSSHRGSRYSSMPTPPAMRDVPAECNSLWLPRHGSRYSLPAVPPSTSLIPTGTSKSNPGGLRLPRGRANKIDPVLPSGEEAGEDAEDADDEDSQDNKDVYRARSCKTKKPPVPEPVKSAGSSTRKHPLPLPFILETSPQCKRRIIYKPVGAPPVTASRDVIYIPAVIKEMSSEKGAIKTERKRVVLVARLKNKTKKGAARFEDREEAKEENEAVEKEDELEKEEEKPARDATDAAETVDELVLVYRS